MPKAKTLKVKINKSFINSIELPEREKGKEDVAVSIVRKDDSLKGFGVRIWDSGRITYIVDAWHPIRKTHARYTVGHHGQITPEQARRLAAKLIAEIAEGKDPLEEKRKKIEELESTKRGLMTLSEAWAEHMEAKSLKEKTKQVNKAVFAKAFPDWADLPMTQITKEMVIKRFAELSAHKGPRSNQDGSKSFANLSMRVLKAVFNSYIDRHETMTVNPVAKAFKVVKWNKSVRREDFIKDHELADWYGALPGIKSDTTRDFFLVLIFTGLRYSECAKLSWADIDLKGKTLTIPPERTKNGESHCLPLSEQLYAILSRRFRDRNIASPFVFPAKKDFMKPMGEITREKEKFIKRSGIKFTCHGLRRTFETVTERVDIPYITQKKLLNHKTDDITARYIIVTVEDLREPMQKVTDYLINKMLPKPEERLAVE